MNNVPFLSDSATVSDDERRDHGEYKAQTWESKNRKGLRKNEKTEDTQNQKRGSFTLCQHIESGGKKATAKGKETPNNMKVGKRLTNTKCAYADQSRISELLYKITTLSV